MPCTAARSRPYLPFSNRSRCVASAGVTVNRRSDVSFSAATNNEPLQLPQLGPKTNAAPDVANVTFPDDQIGSFMPRAAPPLWCTAGQP